MLPNPGGAVVSRAASTMIWGQVVLTPRTCGRAPVSGPGLVTWATAQPASMNINDDGFIVFWGGIWLLNDRVMK